MRPSIAARPPKRYGIGECHDEWVIEDVDDEGANELVFVMVLIFLF
jgi:hypothetical protein